MYKPHYFTENEFKKVHCRMADMDERTLILLDSLREAAGVPLVLTSAFRTFDQNLYAGGAPNSAHLKGLAVDIACNSSATRYAIIRACFSVGICRIGIGKNFIHVDIDESLPQNVIWNY